MNDTRAVIERIGERYALPNDAFERMLRRRDRKRRNQRVAATTVAFAVFVAALAFVLGGNRFDRSERPAVPVPPSASNGDLTYVGADVIDFSDRSSDFGILFLVDPAGGTPRKILEACPSGPGETTPCEGVGFGSVDWSPDGTSIAYELDGFPPGQSELEGIYVMEIATEQVHQLTSCTAPCVVQRDVDWSPSGSRIAFSQAESSGCDLADSFSGTCSSLYTMKSDGTDRVRIPTGSVAEPVDPSWSPDGASIAFSARVGEDWFVYTMAVDGSELTQLAADLPSPEPTQPAWSPDGSTIAFVAWEGAAVGAEPTQVDMSMGLPFKLWAMAPDGSERRLLTEGCCFIGGAGYGVQGPEWSPDGTQIALMEGTGGSVRVIDAETGEYFSLPGRPTGPIAWQPIPIP